MTGVAVVALGLACLWFPIGFCVAVARAGRRGGVRDRLGLLDGLATAVVGVLLSWLLLPWGALPALLWAVPVALTAYGVATAVLLWPGLPAVAGRRRGLRVAGTAGGVALTGLLAVLLVA